MAVAASVNFPAIFLSLYWKDLTTKGAIAGGITGLVVVVILTVFGPIVWVDVLGNEKAIFPYAYPTLFSVGAAFAVTILVRNRRVDVGLPEEYEDKNLATIREVLPLETKLGDGKPPILVEESSIGKEDDGRSYVWKVEGATVAD